MAAINTRNYSWAECEIRLAGRVLTSIEGVSWNHKQEKTPIYGKGTKALAIKAGNELVDGSLSLLQGELEQILDMAPDGKAVNIDDLDIQVAFVDKLGNMVRYSILGVSFTEEPHDHKQNDPVGRMVLPFVALDSKRI